MSQRIGQAVRTVWINVGVGLLVLVMLEGAFQLFFLIRDRARPATSVVTVDRLQAANPGQEWVRDYHAELIVAVRERWRPYVYWRARPYKGAHISIDDDGLRRTWNASPSPAPGQAKIFMFGGSTLWGYGARDEFTIPSLVSKKLASRLPAAPYVVNYGEPGYVSTQELITLILELRKGNVPDVVIFYDGVNDAWAAFQSGVAGIPQNEINRVTEFNSRNRVAWRQGLLEKVGLYRFMRGVLGSLGAAPAEGASRRFLEPALAGTTVDVYLANVRLVNMLAREYGFRAVFYWQPSIYSKKVLSPDEERWRLTGARRGRRGGATPLFAEEYRVFNEAFREKLRTSRIENVHDLSRSFENDSRTIYIDRFHISEHGNDKVADDILRTLQPIVAGVKR
ncbi:MAG: SGNH/GDSL hydrolase family protein [Armatimonadota bacterium]